MLKIDLLGYPTIHVGTESIVISRRKALALLVYLVITRRPHTREHLCNLLWTMDDPQTARAELRRMLSVLNQSAVGTYIKADRQTLQISKLAAIETDVWQLERLLNEGNWAAVDEKIEHWATSFLQSFYVDNAPQFDTWQQLTNTQLHQRLVPVLEQLVLQAQAQNRYPDAIRLLSGWLMLDPENEILHRWMLRCYVQNGQQNLALEHYERLAQRCAQENDTLDDETITLAQRIRQGQPFDTLTFGGGVLPPMPQMLIGRDEVLATLRTRLEPSGDTGAFTRVVVQGWPGIGKTTITAALAHDSLLQARFKDGIFWASLGKTPDILAILVQWGTAMGVDNVQQMTSVKDASQLLAQTLSTKTVLLIVDDIWDEAHFTPLNIGTTQSVTLITTRLNRVAQALIRHNKELFKLPLLSDEQALMLLETLTPDTVAKYPEATKMLVRDLEGLPLAIQVAGRLLREEFALGWGIEDLLEELQKGTRLLQARAPHDRQHPEDDVPTTLSALLSLSTSSLDVNSRKCFALLGVFAPKPAIFELEAMQAVWEIEDARPIVRRLVERGLLEVVPGGQFQMHALLVQHARSLFGQNGEG